MDPNTWNPSYEAFIHIALAVAILAGLAWCLVSIYSRDE
jgi:hypothetical protein